MSFLAGDFFPCSFNEGADGGGVGPMGRKLIIGGDLTTNCTEDVER